MEAFNQPVLLYFLALIYGLVIGSLLNVIIHRVPIQLKAEWFAHCCEYIAQKIPEPPAINLFFPRSFCPQCKTSIKARHNVPLLSWLWLRGKCHACNTAISIRYPIIELLTGLLFVYTTWHFGLTLQLLFALIFVSVIIVLFFIDIDQQLLPDSLTLGLLWTGLIANTQSLFTTLPDAVLSAAIAWISLWGFIKLYALITGKIGMGHGDFKLFAALGAFFGWVYLPFILLFSCLLGSITGLVVLKWQQKPANTPIPFGPFLCLGGLIVLFWGETLLSWYLQQFSVY